MKKGIVIYSTGTGNTAYLAGKIKARFEEKGYSFDLFEVVSSSKRVDLSQYSLIVLSYPVYAFNMPVIFERYVSSLDLSRGGSYLICKQSGEPLSLNDSSDYRLLRLIAKSGRPFLGAYHYLYPYNIHFRYPDDFVKELLNYDSLLMDIMMAELERGTVRRRPYSLLRAFVGSVLKIQRAGAKLNSFFYKVDEDKCVRCLRCVNLCPTKNIRFEKGKIVFSHRCIMCMRCSFLCPKDAIGIGMLEKWKVNGPYPLAKIEADPSLKGEYSSRFEKGFYSWFKKAFAEAEREHRHYFGK